MATYKIVGGKFVKTSSSSRTIPSPPKTSSSRTVTTSTGKTVTARPTTVRRGGGSGSKALEIIDKSTGKSVGYRGSSGRTYKTEKQAVESMQKTEVSPVTGSNKFGMAPSTKFIEYDPKTKRVVSEKRVVGRRVSSKDTGTRIEKPEQQLASIKQAVESMQKTEVSPVTGSNKFGMAPSTKFIEYDPKTKRVVSEKRVVGRRVSSKDTGTRIEKPEQQLASIKQGVEEQSQKVNRLEQQYTKQSRLYEQKVDRFNQKVESGNISESEYNKKVKGLNKEFEKLESSYEKYQSAVSTTRFLGPKYEEFAVPYYESKGQAVSKLSGIAEEQRFDFEKPFVPQADLRKPSKEIKPLSEQPFDFKGAEFRVDKPKGKKLKQKTTSQLLSEGAFGTALKLEAQQLQPFTDKGLDIGIGVRRLGLEIASIPGEAGQLIGSGTARVLGQEPVFEEDTKFIFTGTQGKTRVAEAYSPSKAFSETQKSFGRDPFGTTLDIGLKGLTLAPGASFVAKATFRGATKVGTIGKTFIPSSKLVSPKVASGQTPFPYVRGIKDAVRTYKTTPYKSALSTGDDYVYSATDFPFKPFKGRRITVTSGRGLEKFGDVPGLYTSTKGVSIYFLRLQKGFKLDYSLPTRIFPRGLIPRSPKILAIKQAPQRIPQGFRTSLGKAQEFFGKTKETIKTRDLGRVAQLSKAKPGRPYYSPALEFGLKKEAEAVIIVDSEFKRSVLSGFWQKLTGFKAYTKIGGRRIPLYELEAVSKPSKAVSGFAKVGKQTLNLSSYYAPTEKALVSASSLAFGSSLVRSFVSKPRPSSTRDFVGSKSSFVSRKGFVSKPMGSVKSLRKSVFKEPQIVSRSFKNVKSRKSISDFSGIVSKPSISIAKPRISKTSPSKSVSRISGKPSKTTPRPRTREINFVSKVDKKPSGEFHAYTRRNKNTKWVKVTKKPLPYNAAFNKGLQVADNTTARSVKLKRKGKKTNKFDDPFLNDYKFRRRKRKSRVPGEETILVEKSKFAIDTLGEKKGLKASKYKRGFNPWVL